MKLHCILFAMVAVACSDASVADEHPPVISSTTGPQEQPDLSGLASHQSAVGPCAAPPGWRHKLTDPVMLSAVGDPSVCPNAWYASTDPFTWRVATPNGARPYVPSGACTWTLAALYPYQSTCKIVQWFSCPNGISYQATTTAVSSNWGQATVRIVGTSPGCQRTVQGTFNFEAL